MDIAYDEIPERHYKESEVMGVTSLTSGHAVYVCMRVNVRDKGRAGRRMKREEQRRAYGDGQKTCASRLTESCVIFLEQRRLIFDHQLAICLLRGMETHVCAWGR